MITAITCTVLGFCVAGVVEQPTLYNIAWSALAAAGALVTRHYAVK